MMDDKIVIEHLVVASDQLWADGCPVAQEGRRTAEVALRRWRSFGRRSKRRRPTFDNRVEDLAKGLRDSLEPDRTLVGPLMEDYRHLAQVFAEVLCSYPSLASRRWRRGAATIAPLIEARLIEARFPPYPDTTP